MGQNRLYYSSARYKISWRRTWTLQTYFEDGYKNTGDVPIYKNIKF